MSNNVDERGDCRLVDGVKCNVFDEQFSVRLERVARISAQLAATDQCDAASTSTGALSNSDQVA